MEPREPFRIPEWLPVPVLKSVLLLLLLYTKVIYSQLCSMQHAEPPPPTAISSFGGCLWVLTQTIVQRLAELCKNYNVQRWWWDCRLR